MVARGDLGVELPLEKVPGIQKRSPAPAAATASRSRRDPDAGIDDLQPGADACGSLRRRDRDLRGRRRHHAVGGIRCRAIPGRSNRDHGPHRAGNGIRSDLSHHLRRPARRAGSHRRRRHCRRDASIAETLDLSAIICWTSSGSTAFRVARERPEPPIVAISPNLSTGRKLSLVWGVHCVVAEDADDQDDMVERACRIAFKDGFAKAGRRVIIVAGVPLGTPGATNMVRIAFVGSDLAEPPH